MVHYHPLLKNAIELHCHSSPSIFPRKQTDWELIEDVKAAKMAGVVLKAHESQTADRAALIREKEPGVTVYGGIVLNYFSGGLSPSAVDSAIRLGAKMVWMPTFSSQQHRSHFARKKTRFFESGKRPLVHPEQGLEIWDGDRNILPQVYEILDLIAESGVVLASGHLSVREVDVLIDAAIDHGIKKILIQHADLGISPVPFEQQKQWARKGAMIEKCYLACSDDFKDLTLQEMAAGIHELGAESCVLVTDYGQSHNVPVVQAFSEFVENMLKFGVSESQIEQMIVNNPHLLLEG